MYTQETLESLMKSDLVKLGEYLELPNKLNMRMLKGDMIDEILGYIAQESAVEEEPPMSVRVRRIKELNQE